MSKICFAGGIPSSSPKWTRTRARSESESRSPCVTTTTGLSSVMKIEASSHYYLKIMHNMLCFISNDDHSKHCTVHKLTLIHIMTIERPKPRPKHIIWGQKCLLDCCRVHRTGLWLPKKLLSHNQVMAAAILVSKQQ
jgi:hypothetical protein